MNEPSDWRTLNRANWDERVAVHLQAPSYNLTALRAGRGQLDPIAEAEVGGVTGRRVLHLQCHFGRDTLILAQRGADIVGLDFSAPAIETARQLAAELGLSERARFVQADLYDAPSAIPEPAAFDLVFVTWGALGWLPDVRRWAKVVAHFLKPGGELYLAEGHPFALVFDDSTGTGDGLPGWYLPYFHQAASREDESRDYADPSARLDNTITYQWMHGIGTVVTALSEAGLKLQWLREHDASAWRKFEALVHGADGMWRWRDKPWLPLAYSLRARRPLLAE